MTDQGVVVGGGEIGATSQGYFLLPTHTNIYLWSFPFV